MDSPHRALAMAAALLIALATVSGASQVPNPAVGRSLAAQEEIAPFRSESPIDKLRQQWVTDWNLKEINQIMPLYAPDAMFFTASGERAIGQAAIRELFERMRDSNISNLRLHSLAVEHSGDLAYDSGSYRETVALPDNPEHEIQGSYLAVYKLQPDGRWLIVQHVWTAASTPHVVVKPLGGP